MQQIDKKIIEQAAVGDMNAFEEIFRVSSKYVYNVAYRIVGSFEDAQDVAQEVFILIHRKLHSFRHDSSFKTWVYRITVNTALNFVKKNTKHKSKVGEFDETYMAVEKINDQQKKIDQQYDREMIDKLLQVLNPDQRTCIILRNIEGLSYQEIADTLNININTVRTRLSRARESLLTLRKEVAKNAL